jgi:hypothetical protein
VGCGVGDFDGGYGGDAEVAGVKEGCMRFNAEGAEEQRRHFYKINRIGRKSCFGIKTERFCGKIRVIL